MKDAFPVSGAVAGGTFLDTRQGVEAEGMLQTDLVKIILIFL